MAISKVLFSLELFCVLGEENAIDSRRSEESDANEPPNKRKKVEKGAEHHNKESDFAKKHLEVKKDRFRKSSKKTGNNYYCLFC